MKWLKVIVEIIVIVVDKLSQVIGNGAQGVMNFFSKEE